MLVPSVNLNVIFLNCSLYASVTSVTVPFAVYLASKTLPSAKSLAAAKISVTVASITSGVGSGSGFGSGVTSPPSANTNLAGYDVANLSIELTLNVLYVPYVPI